LYLIGDRQKPCDENWDVRQAAVQELARGWKEDPETLSILKQRASSDEGKVSITSMRPW